jgi:hypothetical protein
LIEKLTDPRPVFGDAAGKNVAEIRCFEESRMASDVALSFARDIRPMFTQTDIDHMKAMMDLSDRDSVREHADAIYQVVASGSMPPANSGEPRWTAEMCARFKQWADQGGAQ